MAERTDELAVTTGRFSELLASGAKAALLTHCLFLVVFAAIGEPLLALVNVGSVAAYAVGIRLARQRRVGPAIAIAFTEVLGHAVLAVWRLGWDSGFHLYLVVLLGLLFVGPLSGARRARVIAAAVALGAFYVAIDLLMGGRPAAQAHGPAVIALLRNFNRISVFVLLSYLWMYFSDSVLGAERRLLEIASTDMLSGLGNRRHAVRSMEGAVREAARRAEPACVILADIDDFKRLNDTHGHEAGDRAIVQVAERLRAVGRPGDHVARWGGEEFVVVLPQTAPVEAQAIARRIHGAIQARPLDLGAAAIPVTLTLGVAAHVPGETVEQWIARADRALYRGKTSGKNRTELARAA